MQCIFPQDREKQLRTHLAGTVEELKKFNSRRRLRAATLAAAAADDEEDEEQQPRKAVMLEEACSAGRYILLVVRERDAAIVTYNTVIFFPQGNGLDMTSYEFITAKIYLNCCCNFVM